jgi:hypothetical protein
VADKRCENGHFIDETWDLCPYCPQDASDPGIPVIHPRADASGASRAREDALRPWLTSAQADGRPMERTMAVPRLDAAAVAPRRYVVGWLVGINGSSRGESFPIRVGRNIIGRDRGADVVISDEQASSHHADLVFRPEERRFILMDHNSTNGTYVNEAEIEPRRDLVRDDVIRIGAQKFVFVPLCGEGMFWGDEGLLK